MFILFGGVITGRFSPRKILLICDWISFLLSGVIAMLVFSNSMQVWMVHVFSFISGTISGFVIPAANSITPVLLPEQDLQAGNSITMGTSQLMVFVGTALAGVIIGSYSHSIAGLALVLAIDSVTFSIPGLSITRYGTVMGNRGDLPSCLKSI